MRKTSALQHPPSTWTVPEKMIGIAAEPRCGSSYLCDLMKQTGVLGQPKEFFNPSKTSSEYAGDDKSLADICHLAREMGTSPNGVLAIKFFNNHFPSVERGLAFTEWFGEPVWVWIRRKDMLGQAISYLIARQTSAYNVESAATAEPEYSSIHISELLHKLCTAEARWREYFARTQIAPIEVEYEDFVQDPQQVVHEIADAAGVELDKVIMPPRSTYKKQRTGLNEEWRARFVASMGDPASFSTRRRLIRGDVGDTLFKLFRPKNGRDNFR